MISVNKKQRGEFDLTKRKSRSFVDNFSDEEFVEIVHNSVSFAEVRKKTGYKTTNSYVSPAIKNRIAELNIDISHFVPSSIRQKKAPYVRYTMEEILVENSGYCGSTTLKRRLVSAGYMDNVCACCGLKTWDGKELALQVHHVNGVNNDNRIENLQLLCPNCHSQTDFFGGRSKSARHKRQFKRFQQQTDEKDRCSGKSSK